MENAIRELRAVYGWTQADLASLIGVSRQSVNAIETGKYDPSLPIAFAIGRVFGLPIETIFSDGVEEETDGLDPPALTDPLDVAHEDVADDSDKEAGPPADGSPFA